MIGGRQGGFTGREAQDTAPLQKAQLQISAFVLARASLLLSLFSVPNIVTHPVPPPAAVDATVLRPHYASEGLSFVGYISTRALVLIEPEDLLRTRIYWSRPTRPSPHTSHGPEALNRIERAFPRQKWWFWPPTPRTSAPKHPT
jgi:hypothetical protein